MATRNIECVKDKFLTDICESLYWNDKCWENGNETIAGMYGRDCIENYDKKDMSKAVLYDCYDWDTLNNKDRELFELGKVEELEPVFESLIPLAKKICEIYKYIEEQGKYNLKPTIDLPENEKGIKSIKLITEGMFAMISKDYYVSKPESDERENEVVDWLYKVFVENKVEINWDTKTIMDETMPNYERGYIL